MKNARPINLNEIKDHSNEIEKDPLFISVRNALTKNKVPEIVVNYKDNNNLSNEFSIDNINSTSTITNQNMSGRCWLFATLNMIRDKFAKDNKIENFEFSQSYCAFWDKFERANAFLDNIAKTARLDIDDRLVNSLFSMCNSDGGFFSMSVDVISKYGLVPKSVMPDSFSAQNTLVMNKLVEAKLKQGAKAIRNAVAQGLDVIKERKKILFDIYKILVMCYGEMPKSFDFEYYTKDSKGKKVVKRFKNVTPLQMLKKTKFDLNDYVTITTSPYKKLKYNQMYELEYTSSITEKNDVNFLNVDRNTFKLLTFAMVDSKTPIWFACDVDHFGDRQKGWWDDKSYDFESAFGMKFETNIANQVEFWQVSANHAMSLVGMDYDAEKTKANIKSYFAKNKKFDYESFKELAKQLKINRWKIENSWGSKNGNKGFFVMTDSWFDKYVVDIVVSKKALAQWLKNPSFLEKSQLSKLKDKDLKGKKDIWLYEKLIGEGLKTKPIGLKPWSPLNIQKKGSN